LSLDSEDKIETEQQEEVKETKILVYPNPNDGSFTVSIDNPIDVKEIRISDKFGKVIHSHYDISHENKFNMKILASGLYTVEIVFDDRTVRKKLFIN
jgi:hypothetical protein